MTDDLLEYARINEIGAILLGKNTVVDGYRHGREIGVFTHIHSDHIQYFTSALHECSAIFVSRPTYDLLAALEVNNLNISSDTYFQGRHVFPLNFNESIIPKKYIRQINPKKMYSDQITLFEAHHILGSSQVLVTTDDGKRIAYSSDFSHPKTKPIKCDVLVLDATHGDPMFNAPVDPGSLENRLIDLVEESIEAGKPVCIRAHAGRLQYVMSILSEKIAENIPFLTVRANLRLVPVYRKYGMPIRGDIICSDEKKHKSRMVMECGYPFIEFKKTPERKSMSELNKESVVFYLGGVNLGPRTTIKQSDEHPNNYIIEFGDHGTYDEILNYVRKCSPQLVITDQYRSTWGVPLARCITDSLGIPAYAQP